MLAAEEVRSSGRGDSWVMGVWAVKERETDISPVRRRNHGRILATCWSTLSQIMLRNGNVLRLIFATQETCGTLGSFWRCTT